MNKTYNVNSRENLIDEIDLKLTLDDLGLTKIGRHRQVVYGRQTAYKMMYDNGMSLKKIGTFFDGISGHLDHATVLHGKREYEKNKNYEDFQAISNDIMIKLTPIFFPLNKADVWQDYAISLTQMDALIGEML
jgi:hypothetical protein